MIRREIFRRMADPPASGTETVRCEHCGDAHPVSFTHCPRTGKSVSSGRALVGRTFAERYRILGVLGDGGMGTVYLAEHVIIEKRVALKILSEDFARKPDLVQRFLQEAKAASRIGHENIVDIIDFGETASGSVFIAMEFLDGKDLAGVIREAGALSFDRCRYVVTQICRALGAAHAKGIIHRDMKPENVFLIEREGRPDFVKILDFGIAKISSLDNEGGARLTRTGMIFGTPEYMSPEQARGDRPDHRVDIYAVGCILYEALTGDVPFHADTFMGVLTKHMFEAPEPPSKRAPEKNVAPDVETVVLKALAKDRDARFQTMKDFSTAIAACGGMDAEDGWGNEPSGVIDVQTSLRRVLPSNTSARVPVSTPTPPPAEVSLKPSRTPLLAGGLIALLAIGGAVAWVLIPRTPVTKPDVPPVVGTNPPVDAPKQPLSPPQVPVTAPANVLLTINTNPPGAEIFRGKERLGVTPANVTFPNDKRPVVLSLRKRDFKDRDAEVVADRDRTYDFDLTAIKKPSTPTKPPSTHSDTPPPVTPPGKQTPSGKQPPAKLRDLKDPFADHK